MFTRGPSLGTRLLLLVIVSVLLMVLDHREQHLESVRNGLSVAVYPIRLAVDLPSRALRWAAESLSSRNRLLDENRRLREERLQFLARLQLLEALQAENARLRALLDSAPRLADRVLVANILSVDLDPFQHRLVMDKGSNDEVYVGQAMLDAGGIVGQVTRVEPFSSEAILISDPGHATPVEVNRNGLRTVALGTGDSSRVDLPFLPNNADIHVGDLLVSSGLGGTFPPGYPVARVISVNRLAGEPFAVITAEPTGALNRAREVLLVWNRPAQLPPDADHRPDSQTADPQGSGDGDMAIAGEDSR
jgi:rod shape-determining protein MreC